MDQGDVEASVQAAIDKGKINGAIICATDGKGGFVYEKPFGHRILLSGEKKPHQLDDVLYLASATKILATIAALQCVDDGLLSLTGDLSEVAPELAAKQVLKGFNKDGSPILEPQVRPITLEMLLSHSSGATYDFIDFPVFEWRQKFAPQPKNPADGPKVTVEEAFNYPLGFQPGSGWLYGPGMDWAGRIVERVTGKALGERMHERLFGPLGITDAQFYPVTREDLRARLVDLNPTDPGAVGKAVSGGGGDMNLRGKGDFGGHGLFMTGSDFLKVLRSLLANDGKILKPDTVDTMFEHHLGPEATAAQHAALDGPVGPFFGVGTAATSKLGHGLGGLLTLEDTSGCYGERTLTWGGGLTFAWFIDRKNDLCGAGAIQTKLPLDFSTIDNLKQTFRRDVYRKREKWKNQLLFQ